MKSRRSEICHQAQQRVVSQEPRSRRLKASPRAAQPSAVVAEVPSSTEPKDRGLVERMPTVEEQVKSFGGRVVLSAAGGTARLARLASALCRGCSASCGAMASISAQRSARVFASTPPKRVGSALAGASPKEQARSAEAPPRPMKSEPWQFQAQVGDGHDAPIASTP